MHYSACFRKRLIGSQNILWLVLVVLIIVGNATLGNAFGIKPTDTKSGNVVLKFEVPFPLNIWYPAASRTTTALFTTPVHERTTNIIYGCDNEADECTDRIGQHAPLAVLAGNQWNDNPPFELTSTNTPFCKKLINKTIKAPYHPLCWYMLFRDGEKKAANGEYFDAKKGNVLLYRVHFGDMQFLHSMASRDGEESAITKANVMMWAEFAYKIATGQLGRDVVLNQSGINGMKELFFNRGWTAQQLFIRGDGTYHGDKDFYNFAFGSLLHLIQDSFTVSHTERDEPTGAKCPGTDHYKPGVIRSFHSYVHQDKDKHKREDLQQALDVNLAKSPPTVVDVGRAIKIYYENNRPWEEARQYLECVFELTDPMAKAGPGDQFLPD